MPATAPCPDVRTLQQLLLGLLPGEQAELLETHVSTCDRCGEALRLLPGEDPLVEAVRQARRPVLEASDRPAIEGLMVWLKQKGASRSGLSVTTSPDTLSGQALTPTPHPPVRGSDTAVLFDFLAPAQSSDELGRLGPYRVLAVLGSGGMGVVFLADEHRLDRRVALKAIRPEQVSRPGAKERFLLEARATAKVEHDHVVTVFEADESRGVPYLAMPLLKGESLDDRLEREAGQSLPLDETLRIGREIAEGLAAAHAVGLIHRDIKPGNLWLEAPTARVKVLDFGLARALSGPGSQVSQEGSIVGTPAYMAPEQARPGTPACRIRPLLDGRADLFSLGCVLYQMTTGRRPFHGDDLIATLMSVATDTPVSVREWNPTVPPTLHRLIDQMLQKDPDDRPASAAEVAGAIRTIELEREAGQRPGQGRLRRWSPLLGVGVAVAASLTAAYFAWQKPAETTQTDHPALVTFSSADGPLPVSVRRGEDPVIPIDWQAGGTQELTAGDYEVTLTDAIAGMTLLPERFHVGPGETRDVRLQLVGELTREGFGGLSGGALVVAMHPREAMRCLCGGGDGRLIVWQADVQQKLGILSPKGLETTVRALAVSPDGAQAVTGGGIKGDPESDPSVHLWDLKTYRHVGVIGRHRGSSWVTGLAFASDGKRVASSSHDGTAQVWDVEGRKSLVSLPHTNEAGQKVQVHAVAISPEGGRVATGAGDHLVRLWNVNGGEPQLLKGHTGAVRSVAFLPDGRELVSAAEDGTLIVWDLTKNAVRTPLVGHTKAVTSVAVSTDGRRILSGSQDGTVRLWDTVSGVPVPAFTGSHKAAVTSVAFAPDGRTAVSGGLERTGINVRRWRLPE